MKLQQQEINDLIERLQKGENLPEDYKYKLFPVKQKEAEFKRIMQPHCNPNLLIV